MHTFKQIPYWGRTSFRLAMLFLLLLTPLIIWDSLQLAARVREDEQKTLQSLVRFSTAISAENDTLIAAAREMMLALAQVQALREEDSAACSAFLQRVSRQYSRYTVFAKIDIHGDVVCSSGPTDPFLNVRDAPYIQEALDTNSFVISRFLIGPLSGKPVLIFSQPMHNDAGEISGVVATGLSLDWLEKYLSAMHPQKALVAVLFDGNGTVLANFPPEAYDIGESIKDSPMAQTALHTNDAMLLTMAPDGKEALAALTTVKDVPGELHVACYMERDMALAPVRAAMAQQILIYFLTAALSLTFVIMVSNKLLLRWFHALSAQATSLAHGDLTARSPLPPAGTEMGSLIRVMNNMAQEMQNRDAALRESLVRYHALIENFPDGSVLLFDQNLRYVLADGAGLRDIGLSKDQLLGKTLHEIFEPDLRAQLEPLYHAALKGRHVRLEMPFAQRVYDVRIVPVAYGATPSHGMVVTQEITLRKQAEEALRHANDALEERVRQRTLDLERSNQELQREIRERANVEESLRQSEARLSSIIENTPVGVCITDENDTFTYVNPAFCAIFGYSDQELIGTHITALALQQRREFLLAAHQNLLATGETLHLEGDVLRKDKTRLTVLADAIRIRGKDNSNKGVVFTMDITSRKQAEDSLREAKEMAERASRAKSEFLSIVSHESKTPLNAVIGLAELLRDTHLDDEQRDYVDVLLNSAKVMLRLINDVLDFSRLESQEETISKEPMEIRPLIDQAMNIVSAEAGQKNLKITREIAESIPNVILGDGRNMQRVLQHLLSNAVKFTNQGEVRVTVSCLDTCSGSEDENAIPYETTTPAILAISVSDTGTGIPEDQLQRIFDSFTQLDGTLSRAHGGIGLGLSISRGLVSLMGGTLEVQSAPGKGSVFTFTCPVEIIHT